MNLTYTKGELIAKIWIGIFNLSPNVYIPLSVCHKTYMSYNTCIHMTILNVIKHILSSRIKTSFFVYESHNEKIFYNAFHNMRTKKAPCADSEGGGGQLLQTPPPPPPGKSQNYSVSKPHEYYWSGSPVKAHS